MGTCRHKHRPCPRWNGRVPMFTVETEIFTGFSEIFFSVYPNIFSFNNSLLLLIFPHGIPWRYLRSTPSFSGQGYIKNHWLKLLKFGYSTPPIEMDEIIIHSPSKGLKIAIFIHRHFPNMFLSCSPCLSHFFPRFHPVFTHPFFHMFAPFHPAVSPSFHPSFSLIFLQSSPLFPRPIFTQPFFLPVFHHFFTPEFSTTTFTAQGCRLGVPWDPPWAIGQGADKAPLMVNIASTVAAACRAESSVMPKALKARPGAAGFWAGETAGTCRSYHEKYGGEK